jgi:RimJ/RimL family protein N-acetyltransferase
MFYDIDYRRARAELGIMIGDREYRDKGYGTEAVDSLLTHIFITTSLQVVYLHTLDWNHRARRSFAKSGFHEVKQVRRSGLDFVLMETDRQTWKRLYQDRRGGPQEDQDGRASSDHISDE